MSDETNKLENKIQQNSLVVAKALRNYAKLLTNEPEKYSQEEGKDLDRALRSCPGISDIDVVWVRWSFVAEQQGWTTNGEMIFNRDGLYDYSYPDQIYKDAENW